MKDTHLLHIPVRAIPLDGLLLEGEIALADMDMPEDDRLACPNPLVVRLHATLVNDGLLVRGQAHTVLRCRCDRCLAYYDQPLSVEDICHFDKNVDVDVIDLTDAIREDILLGFAQRSVCRPDCKGLCPQCGQNLNVRMCACEQGGPDGDAWSALDQLDALDKM